MSSELILAYDSALERLAAVSAGLLVFYPQKLPNILVMSEIIELSAMLYQTGSGKCVPNSFETSSVQTRLVGKRAER